MSEESATGFGPRCAVCGERIGPGRAPGTWTHKARLVAACELDGDHPAVPARSPGSSATVTPTRAESISDSGASSPSSPSTS